MALAEDKIRLCALLNGTEWQNIRHSWWWSREQKQIGFYKAPAIGELFAVGRSVSSINLHNWSAVPSSHRKRRSDCHLLMCRQLTSRQMVTLIDRNGFFWFYSSVLPTSEHQQQNWSMNNWIKVLMIGTRKNLKNCGQTKRCRNSFSRIFSTALQ